jgi:hypothetical protein
MKEPISEKAVLFMIKFKNSDFIIGIIPKWFGKNSMVARGVYFV